MNTEQDFMTRDLPPNTDFDDLEARYGTRFGMLWFSDDAYEWPKLLDFYRHADEGQRETINNVLIYLVGYTLPTLVEQAHGTYDS
jgi:hypothetical protein